jgi:predicted Zn finger-like uncharacterized protein
MIIACVNCEKKFNVNSELIPINGRSIQCGSCNHVWFFNHSIQNKIKPVKTEDLEKIISPIKKSDATEESLVKKKDTNEKLNEDKFLTKTSFKNTQIVEYKRKSTFTYSGFLSLVLVAIISFVGFVIILDTFKTPLYNFFPNLEKLLFNLFEVLKDVNLFIKDLI